MKTQKYVSVVANDFGDLDRNYVAQTMVLEQ